MDRNISLVLVFALCIMGAAIVIAATGFSSISALGRNPSAAPKIFTAMIISLVFAAAISIISMLIIFQLFT